jgi:hypothetical protein
MLSHCCASCGKPLGHDSRVYARDLAMWVAACPRCGLAVRWSPRRSRTPLRVWNRLRALNNRLGVALGAAQVAGVLAAVIGGVLADSGPDGLRLALLGDPARLSGGLSGFALLECCCALLAAVSAVAIAPHRHLVARWFAAWTLGVLPVVAILVSLPLLFDQRDTLEKSRAILGEGSWPFVLLACAVPVALSLALAALIAPLHRPFARWFIRRHRRHASQLHATG